MHGPSNTSKELIEENSILKKRVLELEQSEVKQKGLEDALRQSEEKYRGIFDESVAAVYIFDQNKNFINTNKAGQDLLGYSEEELLCMSIPDVDADPLVVLPSHRELLSGGRLINYEHNLRRKDGTIITVLNNSRPLTDIHGNIVGMLSTLIDITDRKRAEEAQHESEIKYHNIFDNAIEGIFQTTRNGRYRTVNPAFAHMFGYESPAEMIAGITNIGKELYVDSEDRKRLIELMDASKGGIKDFEVQLKRRDGSMFWVSINASKRMDDEGVASLIEGSCIDITDKKSSNNELRELSDYLNNLINFASAPIIVWDTEFLITRFNRAFERLTGKSSESVIGKNLTVLFPDDTCKNSMSQIRQTMTGEHWDSVEIPIIHKDGNIRLALWNSANIYGDDNRTLIATIAQGIDITDRRKIEQNLFESKKLYETLTEKSFAGVYVIQDGTFRFLNNQAAFFAGYTPDEILGKRAKSIVLPDDIASLESFSREMLKGERTEPYEFRIITKDGQIRWIMETITSIHYEGTPAILGNSMDITERKHAEKQRNLLELQLRQAQKMEAIGTLAGGIAHDFNNILSAIIGYSEMLLLQSKETTANKHLEQILKASERAKKLVAQILMFSRQKEHEKKPIRITTVVKEVLQLLRSSLPTSIEIRQTIEDDSASILADPNQIHQVLMNLCVNAAHAMNGKNGVLEISITKLIVLPETLSMNPDLKVGPYIRLSIKDTGCGIDPGIMNKIFDPFFTTKAQSEGTGLGLAVVYGIIKGHSGAMIVQSEVGVGTAFHVYLPIINEELTENGNRDDKYIPLGTECILCVDDEEAIVRLNQKFLKSLGYKVVSSMNSKEALNIFYEDPGKFDLIITDLTMPQLSGLELARKILSTRPDMAIILCTGFNDTIEQNDMEQYGIRDLIIKPIFLKDLAQRVRKVLDK